MEDESNKSRAIAFLLCTFLGPLGLHRLYVGKFGTGLIQLFTLGCLGVWSLIDWIMIIAGKFKDHEGKILKH